MKWLRNLFADKKPEVQSTKLPPTSISASEVEMRSIQRASIESGAKVVWNCPIQTVHNSLLGYVVVFKQYEVNGICYASYRLFSLTTGEVTEICNSPLTFKVNRLDEKTIIHIQKKYPQQYKKLLEG